MKNVISIEFNFQIGHVWLKELNLIEIHKMIWSYECVFDKKYFDSFLEKRWYAYPCFRDVELE